MIGGRMVTWLRERRMFGLLPAARANGAELRQVERDLDTLDARVATVVDPATAALLAAQQEVIRAMKAARDETT